MCASALENRGKYEPKNLVKFLKKIWQILSFVGLIGEVLIQFETHLSSWLYSFSIEVTNNELFVGFIDLKNLSSCNFKTNYMLLSSS